jgi:hypothetical protein
MIFAKSREGVVLCAVLGFDRLAAEGWGCGDVGARAGVFGTEVEFGAAFFPSRSAPKAPAEASTAFQLDAGFPAVSWPFSDIRTLVEPPAP